MAKRKPPVEVDENDALIASLRSVAPTGADACSWEISRTTDLVMSQVKYVLTTGIDSFDDIVGGMPFGRMTELFGLESCGKTAMAIRCAARAMKKHICEVIHHEDGLPEYRPLKPEECKIVVVYIDNEQSLDEDGKLVVDGEKLDVVGCRFDTTDDIFKAIDQAIKFQKKRLEEEAKDGIKRFMLIVVDTIASTSTKQELEQKWGTQDFPRQPQQISRGLRKLTRKVNRNNVCILFTNQVRVKFQEAAPKKGGGQSLQIKASDYTSPGGLALRFYASHRVFMYAMQQKYKLLPTSQFAAGLLIGFHTIKNRLRPPLRDGRMVLLFDKKKGGLNNVLSTLENLEFLGFAECGSETKHIDWTLKFAKNGVEPSTFGEKLERTLDDEEEDPAPRRGRKKDPGFKTRAEWPKFYEEHQEDIKKLWDKSIDYAMATEGLEGGVQIEEEEGEEPGSDD